MKLEHLFLKEKKNTKDQIWTPTSDLLLGLEGELSTLENLIQHSILVSVIAFLLQLAPAGKRSEPCERGMTALPW